MTLEDADGAVAAEVQGVDFLALDVALGRLAELDARRAKLVELRFFGGLTVEEAASVLGISPRPVKREWQVARAWLKREMSRLSSSS